MLWRTKYITLILALIFGFFPVENYVSAFDVGRCSKEGYSVITINGMFTTEAQAQTNKEALSQILGGSYKNEKINYQYLLNATHLGGLGDIAEVIYQKYHDTEAVDDFDLEEMLSDAGNKILTEKVLLVGHSQGNFYANSFYKKVANQTGPIPPESIGVYAVASPASYVAGGGLWTTSNTDSVIEGLVEQFLARKILTPNVTITKEQVGNSNGHGFSDIYLQYQAPKIISDIKLSLSRLSPNHVQDPEKPCMSTPVATLIHKTEKFALGVLDPWFAEGHDVWVGSREVGLAVRDMVTNYTDKFYAYFSGKNNTATAILADGDNTSNNSSPGTSAKPADESNDGNSRTVMRVTAAEAEKNNINNTPDASDNYTSPQATNVLSSSDTSSSPITPPSVSASNDAGLPLEEAITHPDLLPGGGGFGTPVNAADTTPPVITLSGSGTMTVALNSVYTDPGASALDAVDGAVTPVLTGAVDTSTLGTYTLTYTATDAASNASTAERKVRVDNGAALDGAHSIYISGGYAYVVSDNNSFEIVDISDPAHPKHVSYLHHGDGGAELFAPKWVYVAGDNAYVASYSNALEVIDVSNKLAPVHKATLLNADAANSLRCPVSLAVSGNYMYIANYYCGNPGDLEVVDISDPAHPTHVAAFYNGASFFPTSVFVSGIYAYVTSTSGEVRIIDISNPLNPVLKGIAVDGNSGITLNNPQSVFVEGTNAYVASRGGHSLEIIDVSDPAAPIHKGTLNDGVGGAALFTPQSVVVSGSYAYTVSFVDGTLEVTDITDPANPTHAGSLADGVGGASINNPYQVFIDGNYAYVASSVGDALEVVDVSNPASPTHVSKLLNGGF